VLEAIVGVALRAILASVLLGGVLAALVLIATRFLALTAATRHALWTTALIATAIMPLAGVGVSMYRFEGASPQAARPPREAWGPRSELATNTTIRHDGSALAPSPSRRVQTNPTASKAPNNTSPLVAAQSFSDRVADRLAFVRWTPRMSRNVAIGVVGVWVLGAIVGLIGLAASLFRVRGLKRRSSPLDGALADELPWLTEIGAGREIYLRLSFEIETPVAIGFGRPVILIPTELATADGLSAIEQLVLHEYAHLRRYDDWTNIVQRTIERIFWFNPIVWLVGRRIALEREIASDDAVVEKTGEPHAYATSLWRLAREMRMPEHAVVAPGALLTRKQITIRIEQLLDKRRARLHRSPAAALGVMVAGVAAVAFVATSAPAVELPVVAEPSAASHAAHLVIARHEATKHVKGVAGRAAFEATTTVLAPKTSRMQSDPNVAPLEQKTVRFEIVTMPTIGPAKHAHQVAHSSQHDAPAPATHAESAGASSAGATTATASSAGTSALGVPPPPAQPGVAEVRHVSPQLTPDQAAKVRAVAERAVARAGRLHDMENVAPEVTKALKIVMTTLPREIAQESSWSHGTRFDGVKLSRELVASCLACSFRNADLRGVDLHGLKINGVDFSGADMRGVNLAGAQLIGVSLARANLANADLRSAELNGVEMRGANFDGAQLEGIRLIGVSIRRVSLHGIALRSVIASCTGCDFAGLDLRGQDLHGISLNGANLSEADLRDANLSGAQLIGVSLNGANLSRADLRSAQLNGTELRGANLDGAQLEGLRLIGVSIRSVSLRGTMLRSAIANCSGCDLSKLDLHAQDLHGISLSGANLSHADLRGANLSGVRFTGVDLSYANLAGADLTNARFDGCNLNGVELRGARTAGMTMSGSQVDG
jgi:uncharacterized protein YjbI with pentapeptide repeats/beta-lactamase regulating signal transducer with metallopeptidase domain